MKEVYVVTHQRPEEAESTGSFKTIGIYETAESANEAVVRAQTRPGFRDFINGFLVDKIDIEKDYWTEGFITSSPATATRRRPARAR